MSFPTSFLKILLEDNFIEEIRIPPSFVKQHEEKVTKEWILRTPPLKKMWAVQVDENGGHYHLRGQAWQKLAKISNLMYGDSLLFLYVGKTRDQDSLSVFDVVLIDGSGLPKSPCQLVLDSITSSLDVVEKDGIINHVTPSTETARPLRTRFVQEGSSDKRVGRSKDSRNSKRSKATEIRAKEEVTSEEEEEVERAGSKIKSKDKIVHFHLTFTKSRINRMHFPAVFVREAKLDKKKIIYLISPKSGKKWKMELCTGADGRISMGRGWSCFRDENRVKRGDTFKFTLVQDEENTMLLAQKDWEDE